jgi:hypothetical protein
MIGGDWQEVDGVDSGVASGVRCCRGFAVHVKMTKEWHVTSNSPASVTDQFELGSPGKWLI